MTDYDDNPSGVVPDPDGPISDIWVFALTYDGYSRFGPGEALKELALKYRQEWTRSGELSDDLHELRCALFFEQRSAHWNDFPSEDSVRFTRALVRQIAELSGGRVEPVDPNLC